MIIDFARRGAVTSWVGVELGVFCKYFSLVASLRPYYIGLTNSPTCIIPSAFLWALWLATGAYISATTNLKFLKELGLPESCSGLDDLASKSPLLRILDTIAPTDLSPKGTIDELEIENPRQYGFLKALDVDDFGRECREQTAAQGLAFIIFSFRE